MSMQQIREIPSPDPPRERQEQEVLKALPAGYVHASHGFGPVYDAHSRILILGSFPSVKSRQEAFFYAHPQNRFWRLLAHLFKAPVPASTPEKKAFLSRFHIALWDVIEECDVLSSSDASIRNALPVDLNRILTAADIRIILTNGALADRLYKKYFEKKTGIKAVRCPSTSPANAAWSFDRLLDAWGEALNPLAEK